MAILRDTYHNVHKPAHYTQGRKYEPKDVIRDWGLNFNLGSAVKYLSRAGRKDDIIQDLKKAQEFIQFEIDALEEELLGNSCVRLAVPEGVELPKDLRLKGRVTTDENN